jgi:Uma2 family endonuclease
MEAEMAAHGVRFLASDIWDTPDNGKKYEVIDGDLYVTPPPHWEHQEQLSNLDYFVKNWVKSHRLGRIVQSPVGLVLDDENGIEPDLVFVGSERVRIIRKRGVFGAPDLVVEVLSPSTADRDRGIKLRRYAAAGVRHYWILDTDGPRIEERVLGEDGYRLVGTFGPGEVFCPTLFPGLEIPMDEIAIDVVAD